MALRNGTAGADLLIGTASADLLYGFDVDGAQASSGAVRAVDLGIAFNQPLQVVGVPTDPDLLLVVEKPGTVRVVDTRLGSVRDEAFLDLGGQVATDGEQGLLGVAFHPDFALNRQVFAAFSTPAGRDVEIRSWEVAPGRAFQVDAASARTVLTVPYPDDRTNHRAGWIGFGPDGMLYVATGDGGGANDPDENARNPLSPLGKILRIDVDQDAFPGDGARNYGIPADNPFAGATPGLDEVWALGLRNPFRNAFDPATGRLFLADVGQNAREEIDLGARGADYGWVRFEGTLALENGALDGLTFPIHEYDRAVGQSVIGGFVVRGPQGALQGQYLFADFVSGNVWALREEMGGWTRRDLLPEAQQRSWSGFGEDARGDLYLADLGGAVFRLAVPQSAMDGADEIRAGGGDDYAWGGSTGDRIFGEGGDDRLQGQRGDDRLHGGEGADQLFGGEANDWLAGKSGADLVDGGGGFDTASYLGSLRAVELDLRTGQGRGGEAQGDTLFGIEGAEGSVLGDRLIGNWAANLLNGAAGDDRLQGNDGSDVLLGGAGRDRLEGGRGPDTLVGGPGSDLLLGGAGPDRFVFQGTTQSVPGAADEVLDFGLGDTFDLGGMQQEGFVYRGYGSLVGGGTESVRLRLVERGTLIEADLGDGVADFAVLVRGVVTLGRDDLLF